MSKQRPPKEGKMSQQAEDRSSQPDVVRENLASNGWQSSGKAHHDDDASSDLGPDGVEERSGRFTPIEVCGPDGGAYSGCGFLG